MDAISYTAASANLVDLKIVIKTHIISILHTIIGVLKYSIPNSFDQNPAISTFFRKVHPMKGNSPDSN